MDPLERLFIPEADGDFGVVFSKSIKTVLQYKSLLEDYKIDFEAVKRIAEHYDKLRERRRHNFKMQDNNSDSFLFKVFDKEFKLQLNKIKAQKN